MAETTREVEALAEGRIFTAIVHAVREALLDGLASGLTLREAGAGVLSEIPLLARGLGFHDPADVARLRDGIGAATTWAALELTGEDLAPSDPDPIRFRLGDLN